MGPSAVARVGYPTPCYRATTPLLTTRPIVFATSRVGRARCLQNTAIRELQREGRGGPRASAATRASISFGQILLIIILNMVSMFALNHVLALRQ